MKEKDLIDGNVLMNQEQLLLRLAQHAIKRERFEDLAKIKFKEKGFDLCTISSGKDSDGHFYNVSYSDSNELKSMKIRTKNQKDVIAEENLDQLLNELEKDNKMVSSDNPILAVGCQYQPKGFLRLLIIS